MELRSSACSADEIFLFGTNLAEFSHDVSAENAMADEEHCAAKERDKCESVDTAGAVINYRDAPAEKLLEAARSGDQRAFMELSGRSAASVQKRVFSILRNREDTEDALQDALFKAYTHLAQFRGTCKFSTWLTRIAINSALMQLRKKRSLSEVSIQQRGDDDQITECWEFPDPSPNAEQMYARRQMIERLSTAVQGLPSCYRNIVHHYHEQESSMQEAAEALGITVAAAKSRLLRARLSIRSRLETKRVSVADACF